MNFDFLRDESWKDIKEIIVFGYGKQGRKILKTLQKDFKIICIVDNDREKVRKQENSIPVLHFEETLELLKKYKIIVTVAEFYYKEIKRQLEEIDLIENENFIMYQSFIVGWNYKYRQKIYMLKTDVTVTSLCSLKCENCLLFMPYWKKQISFDVQSLKDDADAFFRCVDYVLDMNIVGGEPFLYKDLNELLSWYGNRYRKQIGHFGIITNGTIIPGEETMEIIKKYDIVVSISDYSDTLNYKDKVDKLCDVLEKNGIKYIRNTKIQWFDFGFPKNKYCYRGAEIQRHMKQCNTICHCLNDKKFYYCATAWAADRAGLYPYGSKGYVNLDEINENDLLDKKRILECSCGEFDGGFVDLCRVCGGYGNDNGNKIETAIQLQE